MHHHTIKTLCSAKPPLKLKLNYEKDKQWEKAEWEINTAKQQLTMLDNDLPFVFLVQILVRCGTVWNLWDDITPASCTLPSAPRCPLSLSERIVCYVCLVHFGLVFSTLSFLCVQSNSGGNANKLPDDGIRSSFLRAGRRPWDAEFPVERETTTRVRSVWRWTNLHNKPSLPGFLKTTALPGFAYVSTRGGTPLCAHKLPNIAQIFYWARWREWKPKFKLGTYKCIFYIWKAINIDYKYLKSGTRNRFEGQLCILSKLILY